MKNSVLFKQSSKFRVRAPLFCSFFLIFEKMEHRNKSIQHALPFLERDGFVSLFQMRARFYFK